MDHASNDARIVGSLLKWAGISLCATGFIQFISALPRNDLVSAPLDAVVGHIAFSDIGVLKLVIGLVCGLLGGILFVIGRKNTVRTATMVRFKDRRNPVVFLRSFQLDTGNTQISGSPIGWGLITHKTLGRTLPAYWAYDCHRRSGR